jgi:hypothetical protein
MISTNPTQRPKKLRLFNMSKWANVARVLKSRGPVNSAFISEFEISAAGITLGDPIDLGALRHAR